MFFMTPILVIAILAMTFFLAVFIFILAAPHLLKKFKSLKCVKDERRKDAFDKRQEGKFISHGVYCRIIAADEEAKKTQANR